MDTSRGLIVHRDWVVTVPPQWDPDADEEPTRRRRFSASYVPRFNFSMDEAPRKAKWQFQQQRGRSQSQIWLRVSEFRRERLIHSAGRAGRGTPADPKRWAELLRRTRAAIVMQKRYRGWRVRVEMRVRDAAARVIQRWYRVFFWEFMRHVVLVQRFVRKNRVYKKLMIIKRFGFWWKHRRHARARQVIMGGADGDGGGGQA